MSAWADINCVFQGWPPSEMANMTLEELEQWHDEALKRYPDDEA